MEEEEEYDVSFRSYIPKDIKLQRCKRKQEEVPDMVQEIGERVVELTARNNEQDILALAPKKAAWDLARDLEPKMEELDRQTQIAIVQLLKNKVSNA